jgi:excisionase family DNA binding protein
LSFSNRLHIARSPANGQEVLFFVIRALYAGSVSDAEAPTPAGFPPVLTAAMAAELLQVHVESLRKMVREGRVPCHRFPGGRELRFLRDELLAWLAALPGGPLDEAVPYGAEVRTQAT